MTITDFVSLVIFFFLLTVAIIVCIPFIIAALIVYFLYIGVSKLYYRYFPKKVFVEATGRMSYYEDMIEFGAEITPFRYFER